MSNNNIQVRGRSAEIENSDEIEAETDYEEAPVIDNTGSAKKRDFDAASDDHPLVKAVGQKALKTDVQGGGEFVSEEIYENDEKWVREWLQNAETAIIRRAKMMVELSDEYPDGWLTQMIQIDPDTGETVTADDDSDTETVSIEVPRPLSEVLDAARSLGYDPTIVWDIYRDERKIVTEDNGIGMTPQEFWDNFKTPFSSGSGIDGNTGGNFGIGSNSVEKVHGADGAALVTTRTPRPGNHEGFNAYSYRGGATATDGKVPDDFYGTTFEIPVQTSFDLSSVQEWVEEYADKLRVPILYREHDSGTTPVEEEYEATTFLDDYDDPPIKIDRPGEFSLVSGPYVKPRTSYNEPDNPNTYMVSMKINRNTRHRMSTLWDVVIQIHDEQGRIISGPNRGFYAHNGKVYQTGQNVSQVGELDEDDVVLPVPTGDRDRLKKTDEAYDFFEYIESEVEKKQLEEIADLTQQMDDEDHPSDAILGNKGDWELFHKIVRSASIRNPTEIESKFEKFVEQNDALPEYDDETIEQIFNLFDVVEKSPRPNATTKRSRSETKLGDILAKTSTENVYMAASTGGNFTQAYRVAKRTHDDVEVIVIGRASYYDRYKRRYGFKKLKNVPLVKSDDHDYEIPDEIHEDNKRSSSSSPASGTPETVEERQLKIRESGSNSSIDRRCSVKEAQDELSDGRGFYDNDKLVVFPRNGDERISDNYGLADYAAIVSVTVGEYDALKDFEDVLTPEQFKQWSRDTLIATMDGAMTPKELVEDDRMVVLFKDKTVTRKIAKLSQDQHSAIREKYVNDARDQINWANELPGYDGGYHGDDRGNVPDDEKDDTLFAVAGTKVLQRAKWVFNNELDFGKRDVFGLKLLNRAYGHGNPIEWHNLSKSRSYYKIRVATPNWDDDSAAYNLLPRDRDSKHAQMLLGLHDAGIDPSEKDADELRELIS